MKICYFLEDQPKFIYGRRWQSIAHTFWSSRLLFTLQGHFHNSLLLFGARPIRVHRRASLDASFRREIHDVDELFADLSHAKHPRTLQRVRRSCVDRHCQSIFDWHCQSINLLGLLPTGRDTSHAVVKVKLDPQFDVFFTVFFVFNQGECRHFLLSLWSQSRAPLS